MYLEYFQYLKIISESRTLSEASETLHISQPALSAAMKKLEAEIGYPLLVRHRRGVYLTQEAEEIMPHVEIMLDEYAKIQDKLIGSQEPEQGREYSFSLMTHSFLVDSFLSQMVIDYMNQNIGVNIIMNTAPVEYCIEKLKKGSVDIILLPIPEHMISDVLLLNSDYEKIRLGGDYLAMEMSMSNALVHKDTITRADLYTNPIVFLNDVDGVNQTMAAFYFDLDKFTKSFYTNSISTYRRYIDGNFMAFTFKRMHISTIHLNAGGREHVVLKDLSKRCRFDYYLFYKKEADVAIERFIKELKNSKYFRN